MATPDPPAGLSDGLYTVLQADGRVKFVLARRSRPIGHVILSPDQASELAANALGGAYDAFDQSRMGLVQPAEARQTSNSPFVRITGLGLGTCPIEGHACLVIKVGAAQLGFALPKEKLKEFARWVATTNELDA